MTLTIGGMHRQAVQDVVDALAEVGLSASDDPAAVQAPGVWIATGDLVLDRLDGGGSQRVELHLVVPSQEVPAARRALGDLLDKVCTVIDPDGPIDTAALVQLPDGPPLPAFVVPCDVELNPHPQL